MKHIFLTLAGLVLLLSPHVSQAAIFHFDHPYEVKSEETLVSVLLDTEHEKINAVGGAITIPDGIEVSKISTGNSMVVLWLEAPKQQDGKITFAGIIPGGFQGDGKIFSFTLKSSSAKQVTLEVTDGEVRRNDLDATLVGHTSLKTYFSMRTGTGAMPTEFDDVTAPENFIITIDKDKEFLDGNYFASFATQDKGTGVKGYESAVTWFGTPSNGSWKSVTSPVALTGSDLFKVLYIRATDNVGNMRVEKVGGPYRYAVTLLEVILSVTALCALLYFVRRLSRRSS